jgi:hypothetical protein
MSFCESNDEHGEAEYILKIEDINGKAIDQIALCVDCAQDELWSLSGDRKKLECA